MRSNGWHLTEDVDDFLTRAGDFLRSRPARHTMALTTVERLRTRGAGADGGEATVLGSLEEGGEVRAVCYRRPTRRLSLTALSPGQADALAAHLADLGVHLSGVTASQGTAGAFAGAWQRRTGVTPVLELRVRLHRLAALTPPAPAPAGRGRAAGAQDQDLVVRWCGEFAAAVGEEPAADAGAWAASRFGEKHYTFWETPDGAPVSMAGATSPVAGMVRVDPVYTPAPLRGRGYAAAVTVEVSRAALAAGAADVVLFTDPANPTSNALYRRVGYVPIDDLAGYAFS